MTDQLVAYDPSAAYYDAINMSFGKSYSAEAEQLRGPVAERLPDAKSWLDVGCGTGLHLLELQGHFSAVGVEPHPGLRSIALERLPDVVVHDGDMRTFTLDRTFDVVSCLFSAVGYMLTEADLRRAIARMADHAAPGGLLIVEPWLRPHQWIDGMVMTDTTSENGVSMSRLSVSSIEDGVSRLDFHWQVVPGITPDHIDGRPKPANTGVVSRFTEVHRLGLYTDDQYVAAFESAGFSVDVDQEGLIGRGLFIGSQS